MILSPKPLIFFLNILVSGVSGVASQAQAAAALTGSSTPSLPKNKSAARSSTKMTRASLPVRLTWQVIRSQGRGANMNTASETFAAEGEVLQVAAHIWQLRLVDGSINCALMLPKIGQDGRLVVQRKEFFRLLGVDLPQQGSVMAGDAESDLSDAMQIPLMSSPTRQLETVYRSPDEELYMVKLGASIPSRL